MQGPTVQRKSLGFKAVYGVLDTFVGKVLVFFFLRRQARDTVLFAQTEHRVSLLKQSIAFPHREDFLPLPESLQVM